MDTQKPVFILIHGFDSSNLWWNYKDTGKNKLTKLNLVRNLKKLGDVYEHTMEYFNINYYYSVLFSGYFYGIPRYFRVRG